MTSRVTRRLLGSAGLISVAALTAGTAHAQDTGEGTALQAEPIVVTGERVERSLRRTAASVEVIDGRRLEEKAADDNISDALNDVPNVHFHTTVGAPTIRGQDTQGPNSGAGAFFGGTVPRATVNIDGHYLSFNEFLFGATSVWDVDRIEVFRGPQTTSQGANSIAGALIVKTKDPTFETEVLGQAQYGSRNKARGSIAVSGPVSEDVALRFAADAYGRDTFIDYVNPNFLQGESNQDLRLFNTRSKLLWLPSNLPGFEAKLTLATTYTNGPTSEAATEPFGDLDSVSGSNPSWQQQTLTSILDTSYEFDNGVTVFNQIQFTDLSTRRETEPVAAGSASVDMTNLSNELRVTFGDERSTFSGLAGVYYARTDSDEELFLAGVSSFDDTKDSLGIYTELSYRFLPDWTLTGGIRYQYDRVARSGSSPFAPVDVDFEGSFDAFLPKVSLAYDVTETTTVGALVNRGYNPGGVSFSFTDGAFVEFDEETVWNFELFGRTRLLDDRLFLSANVFYSRFSDAQRFVQTVLPGTNIGQSLTVNAEKARSFGLELSTDWRVLDQLTITGGLGLLQTEITEFSSAVADFEGNEFGRAPNLTFNIGVSWDITDELNFGAQVRYTDGYHSADDNAAGFQVDGYTVADARLSYQVHENAELFGYVNNLFNDGSPTFISINRSVGGNEATVVEPREFGVGVNIRF